MITVVCGQFFQQTTNSCLVQKTQLKLYNWVKRLDLHRTLCSFLGQHASRAEHNKYGIGSSQGPIMVQASVNNPSPPPPPPTHTHCLDSFPVMLVSDMKHTGRIRHGILFTFWPVACEDFLFIKTQKLEDIGFT